jgi:hypothetical protein
MEFPHVALESATAEVEWLIELLMELPLVEKPIPPILMYCDNQRALYKVMSIKENMKSSRHVKWRIKSASRKI